MVAALHAYLNDSDWEELLDTILRVARLEAKKRVSPDKGRASRQSATMRPETPTPAEDAYLWLVSEWERNGMVDVEDARDIIKLISSENEPVSAYYASSHDQR